MCIFTVYKYVVIINRAGVSKASLNIELHVHAGLKKSSVGQGTFHSHLPSGQVPRQVVCQLNKEDSLRAAKFESYLSEALAH